MEVKRVTHKQAILNYIKDFGSITPMQAFYDLGITKLSTRISELRRLDGHEFQIENIKAKNKYGRPINYARYSFKNGGIN